MDMDTALPAGDDSTEAPLGEAGLRTIQKLRHEAASFRTRLRECERQRSLSVAAWRPSSDPRTDGLVGYADLRLGDLLIFDVRLLRDEGAFLLSWPARKPMGSDRLAEIMRPSPGLDGRVLAAVLDYCYPESTVELP